MSVTVKVFDANDVIETHKIHSGKTVVINAQDNVNYQLISDKTGYAPQNILTARDGNDLVITFEEKDVAATLGKDTINEPTLIIKDYYDHEGCNLIVGMHENGNFYAYIPESAQTADAVTALSEEMIRPQVLGGKSLLDPCWVFNPWWLAGGLLLAGAIALAAGGGSKSSGAEVPTLNPPTIADDVQSFLIAPPENATKMAFTYPAIDGSATTVEVQKDASGKWVPKTGTTLPAGVSINPDSGVVTVPKTVVATGTKEIVAKASNESVESTNTVEPYEIAPIVTIDPISKGDTEITGTVNDPNAKVEITLPDGTKVPAVVDPIPVVLPDGTTVYQYTAPVPAGVELPENAQVTANATDSEGKVPSQPVVAKAPEVNIEVNSVALDDVVNQMEAGSETVPVTGKVTGDFNAGDTVTLTINGTKYTGTVNPDGTYSIDVKGADLIADKETGDGKIDASITTTKVPAGSKPYTKEADPYPYDVKTAAPEVEIDPIVKGDTTITGVVNDPEATVEITLPDGSKVQAKVDPNPVTVTLPDGTEQTVYKFEAPVPANSPLKENDSVSAIAKDPFGNTSTPDETIAPQVSIEVNNVTKDDIINKAESGEEKLPVTGKVTGDFNAGDTVTLIVNGNEHTGTVNEDGTYSIDVPVEDLLNDPDGKVDAKITSTAGVRPFTTEMPEPYPYEIDVESPVSLDPIKAGDTELKIKADPEAEIVVTLPGGIELKGKTDENGDLVLPLPKGTTIEEGQSVSVVATDKVGNVSEAATQKAPELNIVIDSVATDEIVNKIESGATDVPVTGTVTGDFNAGDTVTLTINGNPYTGTVDEEGKFSIPVNGADLVADEDKAVDAEVTGTKGSQPYTKEAEPKPYTVDTEITVDLQPIKAGDTQLTVKTEPNADVVVTLSDGTEVKGTADENGDLVLNLPAGTTIKEGQTAKAVASDKAGNTAEDTEKAPGVDIFVNSVAEDDIVNALEKGSETVPVTGKATGDVNVGDTVTLTINNVKYTGTVLDKEGNFRIDVKGEDLIADKEKGDGKVDAKVLATGGSQPYEKAAEPYPYEVDTQAPKVTIDQIIKGDKEITGAVDDPDATVTITLPDGTPVIAEVDPTPIERTKPDGTTETVYKFKAQVPADVTLNEEDTVKAKAVDEAGNPSEEVQTQAPKVTITIDTVATDNILNKEESESQTVPVTGKVDGDFAAGDTVTLKVNGTNYTGTVDEDGNFSIDVLGSDLAKDADKKLEANVESSKGGRTYSASKDAEKPYDVDTEISLDIDPIRAGDTQITGTTEPGATVTVTLPGGTTTTVTADDKGKFTIDLENPIKEGETVSGVAEDKAGNKATDDEKAPAVQIVIDKIAGDNILNAAEAKVEGEEVPVTGTVSGDYVEGDTVTLTIGDQTYTGPVDKDGKFTINVPGKVLKEAATTKLENSENTSGIVKAEVESTYGVRKAGEELPENARTYSKDTESSYTHDPIVTVDIEPIREGDTQLKGKAEPGSTVTITLPGGEVEVEVGDTGEFTVDLDNPIKQGDTVSAVATDKAGNVSTADTETAPTLGIEITKIADDFFLSRNESEHKQIKRDPTTGEPVLDEHGEPEMEDIDVFVEGRVTGDVNVGDTVTISLKVLQRDAEGKPIKENGEYVFVDKTYTGTVEEGNTFKIKVDGKDLSNAVDYPTDHIASLTATVESTKFPEENRPFSATTSKIYEVDLDTTIILNASNPAVENTFTGYVDDPNGEVYITLPDGSHIPAVVNDKPIEYELPDGTTITVYEFTAPYGKDAEEIARVKKLIDGQDVYATVISHGDDKETQKPAKADRDFDGIPDSVEDGEEGYKAPEAAVKAAENARKAYDEALEQFGKTNKTDADVNPEAKTYSPKEIEELTKLKEALDKAIEDANKAIEDMIAKVVDPNHTNEDLTKGPTEEDQGYINGYKARIPDPVEVPEMNDADDDGISDETEDSYRAELKAAKDALKAAEEAFHKLHTDAHADGEIETGEATALTQAANAVAAAREELDELYALYDDKTSTGGETDFDKEDKPNYEHKECLYPWVTTPMIQEKQNSKGTFEQSEMVVKTFADNMEVIIRYTDEKGTNKVLVLGRDAWGGELEVKAVSEYLEKGTYSSPIEQHWVNHGFSKASILAGQTESKAELADMITIKGTPGSEEIYFHPNAVQDGSKITATAWNNLIPFGNDYITAEEDCPEDETKRKEAISKKDFEEVPGDFMLGGTGFAMDNGDHIYINAIGALWQGNTGSADKTIVPFDNAKPMLEVTAGEQTYYVSRVANGRSKQEYAVFKPVEDQGATKYEFVEWVDWDGTGNPSRTQYNKMLTSLKDNNKIFYAHGNSLMINKLALGGEDVEVKLKTQFGTNERGLGVSKLTEVAEGETLSITKIPGTTQIITGKGTVDLGGDGAESLGGFEVNRQNAADFVGFYGNNLGTIGNYTLYKHGPLPGEPTEFANAVYTNQDYGLHFVLIHNDITVI